MHHIEAFLEYEEFSFDYILFSSNNSLFCWFFYETFDAHEFCSKEVCCERTYNVEDLQICRSRLIYYFDENINDLKRYVEQYKKDKNLIIEDDSDYALKTLERKDNCEPIDVGLTVGYLLKFLDKLIDLDQPIKLIFK